MNRKDIPEPIIDYSGIPEPFPYPQASAWGEDDHGWWMSVDILGVEQIFRWVFPGQFYMGSPDDELSRASNEILHSVSLTKGFWLADTACTQELWKAVMKDNPARLRDSAQNPVEQISWEDISDKFLPALEKQTGVTARLPTEAEWEYACRAGTRTPFNLGENITTDQVNFNGNYPYHKADKGEYREKTVPVKSMQSPNDWGLHEMHGNVWEWCHDWYAEYSSVAEQDPKGAEGGTYRVVRGGSWVDGGWDVRSAYRYRHEPDYRFNDFGFRLALG